LKIAYVAYYDLGRNTAATEHILAVVNGFAGSGHTIGLFSPVSFARGVALGVEPIAIPAKHSLFFDRNVATALDAADCGFDMLYLRDFVGAAAIVRWAKSNGVPLIIEHNGLYHAEFPMMRGLKWRLALCYDDKWALGRRVRAAGANIVVAQPIAEFLAKRYNVGHERFRHIPNGADIEKFHPQPDKMALRKKLGLAHADAFWIGYIGAMYPWHLLDNIIGAFEYIARRRNDIILFIGGDGPECDRIFALARKSPVRDRIILKSPLPIEQSPEYTAAFDIGMALMDPRVAPYCWQVKVNHYASCGVPGIVTKCRGFEPLEAAGAIVPAQDLACAGIAATIESLLDREKLAVLGARARKFAEENLSWSGIVARIENVVRTIMIGENDGKV